MDSELFYQYGDGAVLLPAFSIYFWLDPALLPTFSPRVFRFKSTNPGAFDRKRQKFSIRVFTLIFIKT